LKFHGLKPVALKPKKSYYMAKDAKITGTTGSDIEIAVTSEGFAGKGWEGIDMLADVICKHVCTA